MINQEFIERTQNHMEEEIKSYLKYKEMYEAVDLTSFKSKAQQKEALENISRAFECLADADEMTLIIPMHEAEEAGRLEERDRLSNIYYNFATYPYAFTEKKQKFVKEYCPHFDELIRLRELWLKVKEAPVQPKKTKEETLIEKRQNMLKTIDYSKITNMTEWQRKIDELINEVEKIITPIFERIAIQQEIDEKTLRLIIKAELLDVRYNVYKVLNFDITSVKLDTYSSCYKTWIINENKLLKIETILAGGYNIQRLHNRTLVKVIKL